MGVAEMQMLWWMIGQTLRDKIQKEDIKKVLRVANIDKNMEENCLRWFRHVQRRSINKPVRKIENWS